VEEQQARALLDVPRETIGRLERLTSLLAGESKRQNLVSQSSLAELWSRHFLDSAQLARFAPEARDWLDLGSGAGFPGLIIPLVHEAAAVTLVESRRLRCDFLRRAVAELGVEDRVEVVCSRLEAVPARSFDAITARAFAPLERLLPLAERFSTEETIWVLPKGRNAKSELEAALSSWQGDFRLEPSLTDPEAGIIVGRGIRRRPRGR
jgi:16S rRNA (guanine527-N7)-methyltransferase